MGHYSHETHNRHRYCDRRLERRSLWVNSPADYAASYGDGGADRHADRATYGGTYSNAYTVHAGRVRYRDVLERTGDVGY
ncbi:MAG: hypothetical protein WB808_06350 [Candidatus Dormiibacterota bacterium]